MRKILLLVVTLIASASLASAQKVEVLYFHGAKRCITCNAIEKLSKEVVEKDFAEQVKSGKIVFKIVDITKKENAKLAEKYEVTWSSLILVKGKIANNLTTMGFKLAKNKPEEFKAELRKDIANILKQ